MKQFLVVLLLLPLASFAQRDFDFTFYTAKADVKLWANRSDSDAYTKGLVLPRKIEKQNGQLKIYSLTNTADGHTYPVNYMGMSGDNLYNYQSDSLTIEIDVLRQTCRLKGIAFYY